MLSVIFFGCGQEDSKRKKTTQQPVGSYQNQRQPQDFQQSQNAQQAPSFNRADPFDYDPSKLTGNLENFGTALRERVEFEGVKGDRVPGYMYWPSLKVQGRLPALMLQYGLGSDKSDGKIKEVAEAFANEGYAIIVIDIHGVGERKTNSDQGQDQNGQIIQFLSGFNADAFERYRGDYAKTVDYLTSRNEIDIARIAYAGASWGAITGAGFAVDDPRIKSYVSIVGGGNFFGLLPPRHDPYGALQRMKKPTFLINARNDEVILSSFSEALHSIQGNHIRKKWYEANHTLDGVNLQDLASEIMTFLSESLRKNSSSAMN